MPVTRRGGAELRRLLAENHRYVFTLIHSSRAEVLCDRPDVIVLTDEAHAVSTTRSR